MFVRVQGVVFQGDPGHLGRLPNSQAGRIRYHGINMAKMPSFLVSSRQCMHWTCAADGVDAMTSMMPHDVREWFSLFSLFCSFARTTSDEPHVLRFDLAVAVPLPSPGDFWYMRCEGEKKKNAHGQL